MLYLAAWAVVSPMGADLPDESDGPPDRRDDQSGDGGRPGRPHGAEAETRSREECYVALRVNVAAEESVTARRIATEEQAAADKWDKDAEESHWMWSEYQRRWPAEERAQVKRPDDAQGSWRGEGDRSLNPEDNSRVEAACDQIADREREKISPAMRAVESQDPDRHLIGFDRCLKDQDRIKEKVSDTMEEEGCSAEEALSIVPDAIRYTFQYREAHYTQGVWADVERLKGQGFELDKLRNTWTGDQYKGINSQWIDPENGQGFEVQFHTRISYEAKQLTHDAYERLRTHQADKFEELVLEAFQRKVTSDVPVPPGATDIPDIPERGLDAR
jgi:hypothetical protein